ncbi:MAG: histone deacetylase family protein [Rubrivivax sp.]|nr:histone deacetylase family protein [Rubrivivax sp.]
MDAWYSDHHRAHQGQSELFGGKIVTSFETPQRAGRVLDAFLEAGLGLEYAPTDAGLAPILAVHDADYVDFLRGAWDAWHHLGRVHPALPMVWHAGRGLPTERPRHIEGQLGYYAMDAGCAIVAGTWPAAYWSAQCAVAAARAAADATAHGAAATFAICRPPGHHATARAMGGYCYLNNAAIAAEQLRSLGQPRVAVLDIDYHHGNGTQAIFWARDDVFFTSLHADPHDDYPYFSGHADERGEGDGYGATLNLPLPAGTQAPVYLAALDEALDAVDVSGSTATVVSLGVDTFELDPISRFKLREADYLEIGRRLGRRLPRPVVFVFEGGYATDEVGRNAVAVLQGFEAAG